MDAFKKLEKENDGLSITPMMNQGDFISQIISSVLSSIIMGAILAIIVSGALFFVILSAYIGLIIRSIKAISSSLK